MASEETTANPLPESVAETKDTTPLLESDSASADVNEATGPGDAGLGLGGLHKRVSFVHNGTMELKANLKKVVDNQKYIGSQTEQILEELAEMRKTQKDRHNIIKNTVHEEANCCTIS